LWFLIIALVPLIIATGVSYYSSRRVLEEEVSHSLVAVADNKVYQIQVYLDEKEKNATALAHTSDIIVAMEKFSAAFSGAGMASQPYREIDAEYRPFLSYYKRAYDYKNLYLIRSDGQVIFSIEGRIDNRSLYEIALYEDAQLAKTFIKAKDSLQTEISDFEYNPQFKKAAVFIVAPVFKGAALIGMVAVEMDNQGITDLVKDYSGLGDTGETQVVYNKDRNVVFVTPLRFNPDAAFKSSIPLDSKEGLDIQKAAKGKEGFGIYVDYRGKKVLSVQRYVPSFRLGMVVKMDTAEVFSHFHRVEVQKMIGQFHKRSDVTRDAEDYADLHVQTKKGPAHIHMNFMSHRQQRTIQIDFKEKFVEGDLIQNCITEYVQGKRKFCKQLSGDFQDCFRKQLQYFLSNLENPRMMNHLQEAAPLFRQMVTFKKKK